MKINDIKVIKADISNVVDILKLQKDTNSNILTEQNIAEDLNNPNYYYFLLALNDKFIGYIATSISVDTLDILSVVISINYQNMGFGDYLIKYILNFAKENNIISVFLEVRISNIQAIKLYEKNDFIHINTRKNYYSDNFEDAYIMKKDIS